MELWGLGIKTDKDLVLIGVSEEKSILKDVARQREISNPTIYNFDVPSVSFIRDMDLYFDASIGDIILTSKEWRLLNPMITEKLRNKVLMENILEANLRGQDLSLRERKTLEILLKDVRLMLDARLKVERASIFEFLEYMLTKELKGVDRDDREILGLQVQ